MEAASYCARVGAIDIAYSRKDDGKKAAIICSKNILRCCQEKFLRNTVEVFLCYLS
jgi:hypothetical protein